MSSGGSDKSVLNQAIGGANQVFNATYSYDPSTGKWGGKGSFADWGNEGLGQINGANAQRHAIGVAGDAVNLAQAKQNVLLHQQQQQKQQADIQASSGALAIRNTASSAFGASTATPMAMATPGSKLGGDTQNFLGV